MPSILVKTFALEDHGELVFARPLELGCAFAAAEWHLDILVVLVSFNLEFLVADVKETGILVVGFVRESVSCHGFACLDR
jgi:hypothetical protein